MSNLSAAIDRFRATDEALTELFVRRRVSKSGAVEYEPPGIRQIRQGVGAVKSIGRALGSGVRRAVGYLKRKGARVLRRAVYGKCTKDKGKTVFGRCIPWKDVETGKGYTHRKEALNEGSRGVARARRKLALYRKMEKKIDPALGWKEQRDKRSGLLRKLNLAAPYLPGQWGAANAVRYMASKPDAERLTKKAAEPEEIAWTEKYFGRQFEKDPAKFADAKARYFAAMDKMDKIQRKMAAPCLRKMGLPFDVGPWYQSLTKDQKRAWLDCKTDARRAMRRHLKIHKEDADLPDAVHLFREAVTSANVGATTTSGLPVFARAASRRRERCRRRRDQSCEYEDWYSDERKQGI